jgi:hypothetical protein
MDQARAEREEQVRGMVHVESHPCLLTTWSCRDSAGYNEGMNNVQIKGWPHAFQRLL